MEQQQPKQQTAKLFKISRVSNNTVRINPQPYYKNSASNFKFPEPPTEIESSTESRKTSDSFNPPSNPKRDFNTTPSTASKYNFKSVSIVFCDLDEFV